MLWTLLQPVLDTTTNIQMPFNDTAQSFVSAANETLPTSAQDTLTSLLSGFDPLNILPPVLRPHAWLLLLLLGRFSQTLLSAFNSQWDKFIANIMFCACFTDNDSSYGT